jgi:hypothetical protein
VVWSRSTKGSKSVGAEGAPWSAKTARPLPYSRMNMVSLHFSFDTGWCIRHDFPNLAGPLRGGKLGLILARFLHLVQIFRDNGREIAYFNSAGMFLRWLERSSRIVYEVKRRSAGKSILCGWGRISMRDIRAICRCAWNLVGFDMAIGDGQSVLAALATQTG